MPRKRRGQAESLEIVTRDCAGIDIGKDTHYVAVDPDRCEEPVRSFDAFTPDLEEMATLGRQAHRTGIRPNGFPSPTSATRGFRGP